MVSAPVVPGLEQVVAAWAHSGEAAALVRSLKYGKVTAAVTEIADELAMIAPSADLVTWIPSTARHRRRRGFDPSELLARAVARRRGLRARRLLCRGDDVAQTARDRAGRLSGPALMPAGRNRSSRRPRVLVVDDVCTTGSTLRAAATALRGWGAGTVVAAVATAVDQCR